MIEENYFVQQEPSYPSASLIETMKSRIERHSYIKANGLVIAACAWQGFLAQGRGAVCIVIELHEPKPEPVILQFLAENTLLDGIPKLRLGKELQMLSDYNPDEEAIVLFVLKKEELIADTHTYRIIPPLPPPDAWSVFETLV